MANATRKARKTPKEKTIEKLAEVQNSIEKLTSEIEKLQSEEAEIKEQIKKYEIEELYDLMKNNGLTINDLKQKMA